MLKMVLTMFFAKNNFSIVVELQYNPKAVWVLSGVYYH